MSKLYCKFNFRGFKRSNVGHFLAMAIWIAVTLGSVRADAGILIDSMDELRFQSPKEKGKAELIVGKVGKAIRFTFEKGCQNTFFLSRIHGETEWDQADGFSFWVKGDGSNHFGGLQLIYDDDYALRYDYLFPIRSTEWTKRTVAWRDLIPVLPGLKAKPIDPHHGNKPSKISALWVGRWWYWPDYPAHSFAMDDLRLERHIELDAKDLKPVGPPLKHVLSKLKEGKPVTIVTMGDSLTDFNHWANRQVSWPVLLQKQLQEKYRSKITVLNPAIGGTQLRQNLILLPRWLATEPEPDLVTVCFGANDWEAGMRGPQFADTCRDAVERIRRATKGKSDVLIMTTVPSVAHWTTMKELAEACRKVARDLNAGLADVEKAFLIAGRDNKEKLYVWDKTHLSRVGHDVMAQTALEAINSAENDSTR